jgi:hypothetical protein
MPRLFLEPPKMPKPIYIASAPFLTAAATISGELPGATSSGISSPLFTALQEYYTIYSANVKYYFFVLPDIFLAVVHGDKTQDLERAAIHVISPCQSVFTLI